MDAIVINPLPFQIDAAAVLQRMRVRPGSPDEADVRALIAEAATIARPKAIYRMGFIEAREDEAVVISGVRFTSRVLRVNLDPLQRVFAYVGTAGRELAAWADGQEDLLTHYYADAINQAVLGSALGAFQAHLSEIYSVPQLSGMNPGSLGDWPISQQRPLFSLVGDVTAGIGVELTASLLMLPTKSVSGIFYPTEETFASCQLCPRESCPNRRAPYDPELFERKYKAPAQTSESVEVC